MNTNLQDNSHNRYYILTGKWVLVLPHMAKRPWQGMNELVTKERRTSYDEKCYLCSENTPTNNENNKHWHWHMSFYPPLLRSATVKKFMVGYEMFGSPQRDITAEIAAKMIKNLIK